MTHGDQTPPGRGLPDPEDAPAPRAWGPAPRRWVPGDRWAGATRVSNAPAARRSALTPLPEDDEEETSPPRRSAMSPGEDDEVDAVVPRRSALSPLPADDAPVAAPRRSAFTPTEPEDDAAPAPRRSGWVDEEDDGYEDDGDEDDDEETLETAAPRRSSEYAVAARAIQPSLPDLGPSAESAPSPTRAFSPDEPPSPVLDVTSPASPSVQPTLPDPVLSGPYEAALADTDALVESPSAPAPLPWDVADEEEELLAEEEEMVSEGGPVVDEPPVMAVPASTLEAAAVAAEVLAKPEIAALPTAVADDQELFAEEQDMVSEGGHIVEHDLSSVGDDTATWLFGSALTDADHSLYRRPAPGEPETVVDLTPIVIDDPEYDVRKGASPRAKPSPRPSRTPSTTRTRARSARRVHFAWRDHKRMLTITGVVLALLLVVGVGGYLLSRYNPTIAAMTEGNLTLPSTAGRYQRDPAQGSTPSEDPRSKIQTVSATYSVNGTQEFVAIAYRPQTDPSAALQEIQATSIVKVNGGACGRTNDQSRMACAVVSGTTAVLLVTLVDQTTDELISAGNSVAAGIGKT